MSWTDDDNAFLNNAAFSDEATFHISYDGKRIYNCRTWGSEISLVVRKHERDSPKVNVWCALTSDFVNGPFILVEATAYLHTL